MDPRPIAAVIADHAPRLMAIGGVVGVYQGLCEGADCLVIMIEEDTPELRAKLPAELEGYPVRIDAGGPIRPLDGGR